MSQTKVIALIGVLLCSLVLVSTSSAMGSTQYAVNWSVVGAGGASLDSSVYALGNTAGQPAVGLSHSTTYLLCAGYWCGAAVEHRIYLPLVLREVQT